MARNFAPTHKAKIKAILDTIEWDGQTFGDREATGVQHIFDFNISELKAYPAVTISQTNVSSVPEDTHYNRVTCNYRIRVFYKYDNNSKLAEDYVDELASLIQTTLTDYPVGDNVESWEQSSLGGSEEAEDTGQGIVYREIGFITVNRDLRTQNPIP